MTGRTPRKKDRPEKVVVAEVLDALHSAFYPGFFWRQNAGRIQTAAGHWVELGPEGIADVVGLVPTAHGARIVFVECKRRTGKQRAAQAAFQAAVEALGAVYVLARSGPEAVAGVKEGLKGPVPAFPPLPAACPALRSRHAARAPG